MFEGLYAIVDEPHPGGLALGDQVHAVLRAGRQAVCAVQLRAETAASADRVAMARVIGPVCAAAGVPLLVYDDVEAAVSCGAAVGGVHLRNADPQQDAVAQIRSRASEPRTFLVGVTASNAAETRALCAGQPDYLFVGPVARAGGGWRPLTLGLEGLLEACRVASRPVVAFGGLDAELGARAVELGASAVAIRSAPTAHTAEALGTVSGELAAAFRAAAQPLPFAQVLAAIPVLPPEQLEELARWGDDLAVHIGLGLPARFSPWIENGVPMYRPRDLIDLLYVLDKQPGESWQAWSGRAAGGDVDGALVQLRRG